MVSTPGEETIPAARFVTIGKKHPHSQKPIDRPNRSSLWPRRGAIEVEEHQIVPLFMTMRMPRWPWTQMKKAGTFAGTSLDFQTVAYCECTR